MTASAGVRYFGAVAGSLFLRRGDHWAMLAAYTDESGTHGQADILVVATLISPVLEWERLTRSWERILAKYKVANFHAVDCSHGTELFKPPMPKEHRMALYKELVAVMRRYVSHRTWTAIVMPEYMQFFKVHYRSRAKPMAYTLGATGCASRIRRLAEQQDALIPYVFEQGAHGGKYTMAMFQKLIKNGDKDFYRMGSLAVEKRENLAALQAADLHAYEVYKYCADQLAGKNRAVRESFLELMHIKEAGGGGYLFNMEKLRRWFQGVRAGERPINIAVDPLNHRRRFGLTELRRTGKKV